MNGQARRAPGFIYRANVSLAQNSSHFDPNPIESEVNPYEHTPINTLEDDVEEYFETIKDPQEDQILIKRHIKMERHQQSLSLSETPKSIEFQRSKVSYEPKLPWAYDKLNRHNQKQFVDPRSVSKSVDRKQTRQVPTKINQWTQKMDPEDFSNFNPENLPILTPEKQLAEPYLQYTYEESPKQIIFEEKRQLNQTQTSKIAKVNLKKLQQNQLKVNVIQQEEIDIVKALFDSHDRNEDVKLPEDFFDNKIGLKGSLKAFEPYKLVDFMPQSIISSIPKFIRSLLLLKHLEKTLSLAAKRDKITNKSLNSNTNFSSAILQELKLVSKQLYSIDSYEGIEGIFTANSKIQQLKRFLVFQRFSIIIIVYVTVINKFQNYKNYLLNLIKFLIENCLVLLSNLILSKPLSSIVHQHYPLLVKKSLDFIKINNDSINQVILKLSVIDDLFFSSLNKLGKRTAAFTFGQIFKEFLQFLAFYLHKNSLQTKANTFSIAPSPFLKLNSEKYFLVIDATQFSVKDKKGSFTFRPFHQNFLKQMSQHYILINYSFLDPKESKNLVSKFDKANLIKHQLYSHHFQTWPQFSRCLQKVSSSVKNLIYLNCEQNETHLEHYIDLKKWKGDKKDRQLIDILPILMSIPFMKLDCKKVTSAFASCHTDIGKMQETLLPILKKVETQEKQ